MKPLLTLLAELTAKAETDDQPHPVDLKRGLTVSLQIADGAIAVRLWRQNIFPSDTEWLTVIKRLPHRYLAPVGIEPTRYAEFERCVLMATWPISNRMGAVSAPCP